MSIYNTEVNGQWVTLLNTYLNMLARCHKSQNPMFHRYGGRGIEVCERWRNNFEAFYQDMGLPPDGLTLERVNNDAGYSPQNCKWATRAEQALNKTHAVGKFGRGIYFNGSSYTARIKRRGVTQHLGSFNTIDEALTARKSAEESKNEA